MRDGIDISPLSILLDLVKPEIPRSISTRLKTGRASADFECITLNDLKLSESTCNTYHIRINAQYFLLQKFFRQPEFGEAVAAYRAYNPADVVQVYSDELLICTN